VFCTDDESFIEDDDEDGPDLEANLCSVVRSTPVRGEVWLEDSWHYIAGDFKVYALGTTADGQCFCVGSMVCEALENFYKVFFDSPDGVRFPDELKAALMELRRNDGAELRQGGAAAKLTGRTKKNAN
jgi:hypothetical protein